MSPPQASTSPPEDAATAYYRGILHELIDMGADLARLVHKRATAEAAAEPGAPAPNGAPHATPDHTVAFDRIARAVRRTVALARKLAEPAEPGPAANRTAARKRIIREVQDAIGRATRTEPAATAVLDAELAERLDSPDLDDDIGHRPVAEIIADICRDLGLANPAGARPWKRRTPSDIQALCAWAAKGQGAAPHPPGPPAPDPMASENVTRLKPKPG